jgi:hypothetical protein
MVIETRLAVRNLAEEAEIALAHHRRGEQPSRYLG